MNQLEQITAILNQKLTEIYDEVRSSTVEEKHELLDSCVRSLFSSVIVGVYKGFGEEAAQQYAMETALACYKNAEEFCLTDVAIVTCKHCGGELPFATPYCPFCGKETGYELEPQTE